MPTVDKRSSSRTSNTTLIGIDPGKKGCICIYSEGVHKAIPMPPTETEVVSLLESVSHSDCFCMLEKVHSIPGNAARSMFTFGRGVGILVASLIAFRIPFEEVTPQAWHRGLRIPPKGKKETKSQFKRRKLELVKTRHPDLKVKTDLADGVLICDFCIQERK